METSETLLQRYEAVRQRINEAALRCGRRKNNIILVAVTKNASIDQIRQLIEAGHLDFGENRVQNLIQRNAQIDEFLHRRRELAAGHTTGLPENIRWHMIGHLQRNKVKKVVSSCRLIQSVDSLRLAEEIQGIASKFEEPVEVLIQVNITSEKSKSGVVPAAARHLIDQIDTMLGLRPRGLMCIAPLVTGDNGEPDEHKMQAVARDCFGQCQELFDEIKQTGTGGESFDILSMGMSDDFEIAIECGSNLVRVGSAIFGQGTTEPISE